MMAFDPEKELLSGTLGDGREPLAEYSLEYPVLPGPAGRYFAELARRQRAGAERLLPGARYQRQRQTGSLGFTPHRLEGTVTVTYLSEELVSAVGDLTQWRGLQGCVRRRWSVTLGRNSGRPLPLSALLRRPIPKALLWECILPQAAELDPDGCTLYADWRRRCREQFSADRYYLADDGLAFWYPWLTLGPACAGAPTFLVSYEKLRSCLKRPL